MSKTQRRPRWGAWFGSLNGNAPKFHLTPSIEIDLFLGLTVTFHWLGLHLWVKPWHDYNTAEKNRLGAERVLAQIASRKESPC